MVLPKKSRKTTSEDFPLFNLSGLQKKTHNRNSI